MSLNNFKINLTFLCGLIGPCLILVYELEVTEVDCFGLICLVSLIQQSYSSWHGVMVLIS